MKKITAYKVFNANWKCREFQYKIGKTYTHNGGIGLCDSGFHACEKIADCFNYYSFDPKNKIALVEMFGNIKKGDDKCVCSKITIIKEITWNELLILANTGGGNSGIRNSGDLNSGDRNSGYQNSGDQNSGDLNSGYRNSGDRNSGDRNSGYQNSGDRNSGDRNSGDRNSGYRNSGDRNSGDRNSGYQNSGDQNSGDLNSGYLNSGVFCNKQREDTILIFNKKSDITWAEWENSDVYYLSQNLNVTKWILWNNMTDAEKKENPKAFVTEGYIKVFDYKEAWANLWETLEDKQKDLFKNLPNFNSKVFKNITGIKF